MSVYYYHEWKVYRYIRNLNLGGSTSFYAKNTLYKVLYTKCKIMNADIPAGCNITKQNNGCIMIL